MSHGSTSASAQEAILKLSGLLEVAPDLEDFLADHRPDDLVQSRQLCLQAHIRNLTEFAYSYDEEEFESIGLAHLKHLQGAAAKISCLPWLSP